MEELKRRAALKALEYVEDGMVLGGGSGSTVAIFLKLLAEKVRKEDLDVTIIPTSYDVRILALNNGLKIASLDEYPTPDLAIDGADEVDPNKNLIKGGGAALLREKVVDYAAKQLVIIVDETKIVERLCSRFPIPLEVLPFAWKTVVDRLSKMGTATVRYAKRGKVGPIMTDNGNFIVDFRPSRDLIDDLIGLNYKLLSIPGVLETGIFLGTYVDKIIVGTREGVKILR
ncbi:MAG: ribose 5-phosphate isomerase A [Thermoprotei archaeon]|nr:MAG: ribose 5-phosphate isomerase A [Thermoprotei archaeon]